MDSTESEWSQLAAAYGAIEAAQDVEEAVHRLRDIYGIDNITYHLAQTISERVDAPFVKSTYPDAWLSRYLLRGYVRIDPVVREGFERMLPFDWREVGITEDAVEMMEDAIAHGLGAHGYSIPVLDQSARRALLSINASLPDDEWETFINDNAEDLAEVAHRVHAKAVEELYGENDPARLLGPRELECLTWSAQGKNSGEIAIILSLSEFTVRNYLKSARHKLDCATVAQACAKAIKLRLIAAP